MTASSFLMALESVSSTVEPETETLVTALLAPLVVTAKAVVGAVVVERDSL